MFRVSGTERLTGARHNVQEFPRIEGNLPSVLEQVRALLGTLIHRSARLHDLFFKEMPEYPTFAWQEAVVNAVAHRDYAIQGQTVEIWLYEDRMSVLSPGGAPPDVALEDLRAGRPAHASRNPRIARVLADLGVMRDQGEGIPRMFDEMQTSFLRLPEVDVVAGRFSIVLHNEPIFGTGDPRWSQMVRGLPLSVSQKRALVGLVDREFANAEYTKLNATDRDAAYRELQDLVARGFLEMTGVGAGTRYRVARDAVPPFVAMSRANAWRRGWPWLVTSPTPITARRSASIVAPRPRRWPSWFARNSSCGKASGAGRTTSPALPGRSYERNL